MTAGEQRFYDLMTGRGIALTPQPKTFRLPELGTTYRPDFFAPTPGTYFEVISTLSCLIRNVEKYRAFRRIYPDLCLRIVADDGTDYRECPAAATLRGQGGARLGAGRPKIDGLGTVPRPIRLTPRIRAKIERWRAEHRAENFSAAVRQIVDTVVPD